MPIRAVFVYGTLKRGQVRQRCWPCPPQSVVPAWIRGSLYDRADYPALRPGGDRVSGELWRFAEADMGRVVATLDRIEGTNQAGEVDLYRRESVAVFDASDQPLGHAYAYFYETDPRLDGFVRIATPPFQWPRP